MRIKLLPTIIAAAGICAAPLSFSATYQGEISAAYADVDNEFNSEGDFFGVEGKFYFSPVDTKSHPLAEAAFIEKASSVYADLGTYEFKEADAKMNFYQRSIGVDFYIPNTMLYLGAGVNEIKSKYVLPSNGNVPGGRSSSDWDSSWFVKAGVAPVTGLLVWTEFTEDVDVSDEWNINGKYVIPLAGEQALNVEASYERSDLGFYEENVISGAVDYYVDRNLSVGTGFVNSSFDDSVESDSTTDYFVRARNFFTDNISAELSYTDGDYESSLVLGGTIRF